MMDRRRGEDETRLLHHSARAAKLKCTECRDGRRRLKWSGSELSANYLLLVLAAVVVGPEATGKNGFTQVQNDLNGLTVET